MSYDISGKLHKKFDTEKKSETFQAREFVITVEDRGYTNYVKFQLTQDRCQVVDTFNEGDMITVSFDLRGREWQDKYFTNLNAWKVTAEAPAQSPNQEPAQGFESFPSEEPFGTNQGSNNSGGDFEPPF